MKNRGVSVVGLILLFIFAAAILVDGKYSPETSKLVTIHIDGVDDQTIANKVVEMVRMIEGVQTVFLDEKSNLCTFRYDSGKINLKTVERQLAGLGIKFIPVESVKILEPETKKDRQKFLSVKINSASEQ